MSPQYIRREGFVGQHLVVVPAPVRKAAAQHPLLKNLLVTDAGYFPSASGHRVERPHGASTHLMMICLHGEGWARSDDRTVRIRPGELVWLSPDIPHAYGASDSEPWTIVWAHFRGDEVSSWQRELGWTAKLPIAQLDCGVEGVTPLGLDKVYAELESGYSMQHLLGAAVALRAVFCSAIGLTKGAGSIKTAAVRTARVREQILENPARPYRLDELAKAAGLSVPHFCLLFKQQTGYAPIDFLIRQRIRKACQLLDTTDATVAAIAEKVGFEDPYYFSRCFHRIMGSSPRTYRQSVKA